MKQKNLILIAVAVGCGLLAAILVQQVMAKGTKPKAEDFVEVPVAAKDIPIGATIKAKDVEALFVKKKFPKDAVPPAYVSDTQELVDKRTMRPIRQGEVINPADISTHGFIQPPDGYSLVTAPMSLERGAAGFALPGYRVTVIATKKSSKLNRDIVFPLFADALILAIDTSPTAPQANANQNGGGGGQGSGAAGETGFKNMSMVSLAVNPRESILLSHVADGGATLRIALPDQDEKKRQIVLDEYKKLVPSEEEILKIFADEWGTDKKDDDKTPKVETVKVLVPTEAIETGTLLTDEVLEAKFKTVQYPKAFVPEAAAADKGDLLDKYATADLSAGLLAPRACLSKKKPEKQNPVVVSGSIAGVKAEVPDIDTAIPKGYSEEPEPVKKDYVYVKVHTAQGVKTYKYEVLPNGKKVPLGEVTAGLDENEEAK
jgi:Flp pilus assembly protein CpaB